jgi:hypothetical protein
MEAVESIRNEVMTLPDQARLIMVKDAESMARGNEFFLVIKGLRKKINETFDPIITKAHEAHKEALAQKKKVEEPLIFAERWLNSQMTAYTKEQDRLRRAEEERLRQLAIEEEMQRRKLAEDTRLAEAAILEANGAKDQAEQVMAEIFQANEAPVIVAPPPPTIPKVEVRGMATQTTWAFEVVNASLIPREYLTPDFFKIGGVVRALKGNTNIPGIKAIPQTKMKATGR